MLKCVTKYRLAVNGCTVLALSDLHIVVHADLIVSLSLDNHHNVGGGGMDGQRSVTESETDTPTTVIEERVQHVTSESCIQSMIKSKMLLKF